MVLLRELFLFGLVGTAGFIVDSAVLYLVLDVLGLYLGRVLSFLCAATTTWFLNRMVTFSRRHAAAKLHHELSRYLVLMLGGGSVNYLLYALLVARSDAVAGAPVLGVAAGSLAGMLVNYALARLLLYRHERREV